MARALEFRHQGRSFKAALIKVDRDALYGTIEVETRDKWGLRCTVATLAGDGRTLVESGGTAIGYLSADGRWLERAELIAVDARGNRVNSVASSFDAPIDLDTRSTPQRLLDHSIRLTYAIDVLDEIPPLLAEDFGNGAIFKFDFSYRGGTRPDAAFILAGADSSLWMLVGSDGTLEFVGLQQSAGLESDAQDVAAANADELEFGII